MSNNIDCPACGEKRRRNDHLVCSSCYQAYRAETAQALVKGKGEVVSLSDWVLVRASALLERRKGELEGERAKFLHLQKEVHDEAFQRIQKSLGMRRVNREIFCHALQKIKEEVWSERGGHRLFAEMKDREKSVESLISVIEEIRRRRSSSSSSQQTSGLPKP